MVWICSSVNTSRTGRDSEGTQITKLLGLHPKDSVKDTGYHILHNKELLLASSLPRRRQWHPTPVLLPGKSHGQRSLVGCSPWGPQESDMTERLHFHITLSCNGEGNGTPLQCSCLENPRDRAAWWAAVYGVAQNRTRLK